MSNHAAKQKAFYIGNSNKSLHVSLESSLKNLRTSYIDLYYVHWWDYSTSIPEVMQSLHTLILSRKVLYLVRFFPFHIFNATFN
jgi:aryl-alcohol dehydrogenase-like predicted oxidoreductase